jgi:Protein of unknown function (DUF3309)
LIESSSRFSSLTEHDLRANTFGVRREGKPLHTFSGSCSKANAAFGINHSVCAARSRNFRDSHLLAGWNVRDERQRLAGGITMSIGTIILIILVIALLGGFSGVGGGPFYGTGYYGGGGLGLVVIILLILVLLGRI